MKAVLFVLISALLSFSTFASTNVRFGCKLVSGGSLSHPSEVNIYKNLEQSWLQLKYDAVNGDAYTQVDLLGNVQSFGDLFVVYDFKKYNPITREVSGNVTSDMIQIEKSLFKDGPVFEGADSDSPMGFMIWTKKNVSANYYCVMTVRNRF